MPFLYQFQCSWKVDRTDAGDFALGSLQIARDCLFLLQTHQKGPEKTGPLRLLFEKLDTFRCLADAFLRDQTRRRSISISKANSLLMQFLLSYRPTASTFKEPHQLRIGSTNIMKLLTICHRAAPSPALFLATFSSFLHTTKSDRLFNSHFIRFPLASQ
jgi:hypothetical protein